jgi:uncharacterized membrane protein YbhN (UPF0104 family)
MSATSKKWLRNVLRWSIAIFGIWYVVSNMSWYDRVLVAGPGGWPQALRLAEPTAEDAELFKVELDDGSVKTFHRAELLARVDSARITAIDSSGARANYDVLAQNVTGNADRADWPIIVCAPRNLWQRYWNLHTSPTRQILPTHIVGRRPTSVPYPLIDRGIGPMIRNADRSLLMGAIFVFPVVFLITSYRWWLLLHAIQIPMTLARTFVINMVGAFYNTFMPGSTGGDLLKAYYASKLTTHRTRAVMSVIIDRILGLLALVILGGSMAAWQYFHSSPDDPATRKCGQVALGSAAILLATVVGLFVFYHPLLRKITGLDFVMRRLPMQRQVVKALETMQLYRQRPLLILFAILITLPVHAIVVISATLAGMAFDLPLHPLYYWVVVPVVVLAGSIPISPQGAGVMEFFAILLTKRQGCTVSQAFALTMSIRIVQILWNLTGGIFVLRGGFHTPTSEEQQSLDSDDAEPAAAPTGAGASPGAAAAPSAGAQRSLHGINPLE